MDEIIARNVDMELRGWYSNAFQFLCYVFLYVIDKNYEEKLSFPSHLLQLAYADFDLVNCERLI